MQLNPPVRFVGERVVVRQPRIGDATSLVDAVTMSIEHLQPWMEWIAYEPMTVAQREEWIAERLVKWEADEDFAYSYANVAHVGMGVCTEATRMLTTEALQLPGISEVLICHDVANLASQSIPIKLGYTLRRWFERLYRLFPGADFAPQSVIVEGPPWHTTVMTYVLIQGTAPDGNGQLQAYENEFMQRMVLRWGKVTAVLTLEDTQRFVDLLPSLSAIGIIDADSAQITDAVAVLRRSV